MASIPDVDLKPSSSTEPSSSTATATVANVQIEAPKTEIPNETEPKIATEQSSGVQETPAIPSTSQANETDSQTPPSSGGQDEHDNKTVKGVKACEDKDYRKYFKMLQFGVLAPAIKLKMANEGRNPDILE